MPWEWRGGGQWCSGEAEEAWAEDVDRRHPRGLVVRQVALVAESEGVQDDGGALEPAIEHSPER